MKKEELINQNKKALLEWKRMVAETVLFETQRSAEIILKNMFPSLPVDVFVSDDNSATISIGNINISIHSGGEVIGPIR